MDMFNFTVFVVFKMLLGFIIFYKNSANTTGMKDEDRDWK